jgi:NDP-sugar pyrophosphorylase family protein
VAGEEIVVACHTLLLAGGEASRLRGHPDPRVRARPKPLQRIVVGQRSTSLLGLALAELAANGFERVTLLISSAPGRGGDAIRDALETSPHPKLRVDVISEDVPLGTAGAVREAMLQIDAPTFLLLPADLVLAFHLLPRAVSAHLASGRPLTWITTSVASPSSQNIGRVLIDPVTSRVRYSLEGTPADAVPEALRDCVPVTSAGGIVIQRDQTGPLERFFWHGARHGNRPDLYRDFLPWALKEQVEVNAFDLATPVHDLGTPERLDAFRSAEEDPAE